MAGADSRLITGEVGREVNNECWVIDREDFLRFVDEVKNYTVEEIVQKIQATAAVAEGLVLGLLVYKLFLERTAATKVLVPFVSMREGLLIDITRGVDPALQEDFYSQIIASALALGRRYHFDEVHNRHVAALAMQIFDALEPEHGMNRRERMMLEVAATIHDIGMFIRASGHNRHGQYIVLNSEIFGLHQEELAIIGNVVRYHRGELPEPTDFDYIALQREERILVLKMASILRVADALDRGHSQHVKSVSLEKKSEAVILHTTGSFDLSLERKGLEEKADLFQNVFGYRVILL
jgi:exopolyphosphatase/guanosine-5'-triphosphate,3'-diphosphate pyrophosphatase